MDKHATNLWAQYARDIATGQEPSGEYIRKSIERFLELLNDPGEWRFDAAAGEKYIQFIQQYLTHTRGQWAGKPFHLSPWQQFLVVNIFGWFHAEKGYRKHRTALLFVARKSGKTQLAAAIAIAMMVLDKESAGEYVFSATKKDQAKIAFDEVSRMLQRAPKEVKRRFRVNRHDVVAPYDGTCKALSSDANTLDGLSLQLGVLDEYHAQKTSDLWNVLKSSMGSRKNPLMLAISTAGFIKDGPCAEAMKTAKEVLDEVKTDDRTFAMIFQVDEDDDWKDESAWIKANPGIGDSITLEYLRSQARQAMNIGGRAIVEFQTKHCNLFTGSVEVWIQPEILEAQREEWTPPVGHPVYAGLDLASVSDISSLALVFPRNDGSFFLQTFHWLPERAVERKLDRDESSIYGRMAEEFDNVFVTPGNVTDYSAIRQFISGMFLDDSGAFKNDENGIASKYDLKAMAYDRFNSSQLIIDLVNDGIECDPFGQGFVSMSAPSKELERLMLDGDLWHDENDVLKWMFSNIALQFDPAGNVKPSKDKSGDKIDGVVASIMAIGMRMIDEASNKPEEYEIPEEWRPRFI
jgi:phage terminase large subunit-like protein